MSGIAVVFEPWDRAKAAEVIARLKRDGWSVDDDGKIADGFSIDPAAANTSDAAGVIVIWSAAAKRVDAIRKQAEDALRRGRLISTTIDRVKPPEPYAALPYVDLSDALSPTDIDAQRLFFDRIYAVAGPVAYSAGTVHWGSAEEQAQWSAIENSNNPADFDRFLRAFPNSAVAAQVQERIAQMTAWRNGNFNTPVQSGSSGVSGKTIGGVIVAAIVIAAAAGIWMNWDILFPAPTPPYEPPAPVPAPVIPKPAPSSPVIITPPPAYPPPSKNNSADGTVRQLPLCFAADRFSCEMQKGCLWLEFAKTCLQMQPRTDTVPVAPPAQKPPPSGNNFCSAFQGASLCNLMSNCRWFMGQCRPRLQ